jgi:hypothetical protein
MAGRPHATITYDMDGDGVAFRDAHDLLLDGTGIGVDIDFSHEECTFRIAAFNRKR